MLRDALLFLAACFSLFAAAACETGASSSAPSGGEQAEIAAASTIEESVEMWYEREKCGRSRTEPLYLAEEIWANAHCGQIMETLKVPKVDSAEGLIAAFTRYSVDGELYRKVVKLRRVHHPKTGHVYAIWFQLLDPYGENVTPEKKQLSKEVNEWEDASSEWHK